MGNNEELEYGPKKSSSNEEEEEEERFTPGFLGMRRASEALQFDEPKAIESVPPSPPSMSGFNHQLLTMGLTCMGKSKHAFK